MTDLLLIRHAPTEWNGEKRLQGHTDIPLTEESIRWVGCWHLPAGFEAFNWISSPLTRCRQTAQLLSGEEVPTEDRLIEMSFGDWEGERLPELRARLGSEMQENEDRGLDFLPPRGESPRMVQERVAPWLKEVARAGLPTIGVTHFGVIRALMAKALDWPMLGKPPEKLRHGCAHHFQLDENGHPSALQLNIPLTTEEQP